MAKARPWTLRMQQLFTPAEQARIAPYLNDVRARIDLRQQRFVDGLMLDHVDALRWYVDHGLTLEAAIKRLDPAQLDGQGIGHFAYFHARHAESLWPMALQWLQQGTLAQEMPGQRWVFAAGQGAR